jgi:hypothetical protein
MRRLIGVIVGIICAVVLVDTSWEAANAWFPAPIPDDASAADTLALFVMKMPLAGQMVIALGWLVTGAVSAFAALRVARWRW